MRCDLQTHRECACTDQCRQTVSQPAPVYRATNRDIAAIWAFCVVIAVIVGGTYVALRAQEIQFEQDARI